jgi:hypothetical protein
MLFGHLHFAKQAGRLWSFCGWGWILVMIVVLEMWTGLVEEVEPAV